MARRIITRARTTAGTVVAALTVAGVAALTPTAAHAAPPAAHAAHAAHAAPTVAATDVAAPQLVGTVATAPAVVDVTTGDATSRVSVRLTDDLSGVTSATVTLTSPLGWAATIDLQRSRGGTAQDAVWTGLAEFTMFDPTGTWTPTELTADDAADHTLDLTSGLGAGITVVRTADTVAPTLLSASNDVTAVDTTAGPADVELTVRASDDLSGVYSGVFEFTSPDGDQTASGLLSGAPTNGTARSGTWTVDVTFPARSAPGRWTLTHAEIADGQANTTFYDAPGASTPPNLAVTVQTDDDTTLPQLTGFRVGPAAISTGYQQSGPVYAHVDFADTGSGLASAVVTLRRPDGKLLDVEPGDAPYADPTPRSGTSRAGSLVVGVQADFVPGTWTVASVVLTDLAGNVRTYVTAELGSRATFLVSTARNDTAAPSVTGLAFSPIRLDVRTDAADGTLLVGVKDPDAVPAGFDSGTVRLTGPSGTDYVDGTVSSGDLADGDPADGTFRGAFTLDQGAPSGTWKVTALSLSDAAGNTRTYNAADLSATLGSVPTLAVVGTGTPPATAPAAPHLDTVTISGTTAALTWTPPTDTGTAPVVGYVVTPWLGAAPQPAKTVGPVTTTTITGLSGGRTYTFTVAARSSAGTGIASDASDPVTVPVGLPGAPGIGAATITGTSATVGWTAPRDDGGASITDYVVTPWLGTVAQPPVTVGDVRTATVDDLARGRTYTFSVAAVNSAGPGPSSARSTPVSVAATTTALTVSAVAGAVTYGTAAPVTGVLTRADTGAVLADQPVSLQYRSATSAGAWTTSPTTARTTSTGLVSFPDFRPGRSVQVRLVARPEAGFAVATSTTRTVSVRRGLTLGTNHATITRGRTVTLAGELTPADPGTSVRLQRLVAGAWITVATQRADRSGYSFTLPLRTAGTRTFRVSTPADDDFATSTSTTRTVRVR